MGRKIKYKIIISDNNEDLVSYSYMNEDDLLSFELKLEREVLNPCSKILCVSILHKNVLVYSVMK